MPEETVSQKERKPVSLIDPFNRRKHAPEQHDLGRRPVYKSTKTEIDKDNLTVKPVYEPYDLFELVQQGKTQAGVDYMKHLLATGQAVPEDFYDDGKSGLDTTLMPKTIHDAKAMADKAEEDIKAFAKASGAEDEEGYTQAKLEALVSAKVKEIFDKQQAAAASSKNEGGNK